MGVSGVIPMVTDLQAERAGQKKPQAQSHGQAIRDTSSEQKKLTPQKEKRNNGDIIKSLRVRKL